jgi:two-component system, NtrC family, response regulator AtoC
VGRIARLVHCVVMQASDVNAVTSSSHEQSSEPASRVLLMVVGAGQFATHPLDAGATATLGRDPACELQLVHRKISRRHALVHGGGSAGRDVVVEDLGSTNGIFVAGRRLASGAVAELRIGDSFRVGPFTVLVAETEPRETASRGAGPSRMAVLDPTPRGVPAAVMRFAESAISVVIQGETGTGKEVLARTIHELSRRTGPFLGINVAALSDALLESELFGYERGAFTGAAHGKPGLLESAHGGTVFLDEIGEMKPALQAKLLRAIEAREVYRVGGVVPVALDVRFLAATHRNLDAEVAAGRFRQDLMYRLDGVTLHIAPLRARRGAIAELARTFLAEAAAKAGRPMPRFSVDAVAKLSRYSWPGNVRELRAVIERALLLCDGDELDPSAILIDAAVPLDTPESFADLAHHHHGNVSAIARALGTSRSQVHRLALRFGVALDRLRAS